jgi:nitrate reductase gamma subunit
VENAWRAKPAKCQETKVVEFFSAIFHRTILATILGVFVLAADETRMNANKTDVSRLTPSVWFDTGWTLGVTGNQWVSVGMLPAFPWSDGGKGDAGD